MIPLVSNVRLRSLVVFFGLSGGLVSPALAVIDVLVNQAGYEPNAPKVFRAQRNADFGGDGTFQVKRVSDNAVVSSGTLVRKGGLWDKWYWEGDFGSYTTPGDFYVNAVVNGESANSFNFTIGNNTLRSQTGVLVYRWFLTQRCGSAVTDPYDGVFWHGLCHMDDGVRSGPYLHMDAVGGWHDAGDYGKFPHGFAASGVNGLLWLYDNNRSYYDGIDVTANGIPDIIDEALYQARWLVKMVDPGSGHCLQQTRQNRSGSSFVRPESDTNNTICNCNSASSCDACDDRWIDNGTEATPQEMSCCAALIRMHHICVSKGLPTENFASTAWLIWQHRVALANSEGGHNNLGNGPDQLTAGLDLNAWNGDTDAFNRAQSKVQEIADTVNANPAVWDSMGLAEVPGEVAAIAWFSRTYPTNPQATNARNAVIAYLNHNINNMVAGNPVGLVRRDDGGTLQYFPSNPDNNGFFLGHNRFYLMMTWAALEGYRLVGDAAYLKLAMDQYNWVMGSNYFKLCMVDGAGEVNLTRYHHRYKAIPGHQCGDQPGVVPNGIARTYSTGLPQMDLSTDCSQQGRYQTNEGWLINNAAYAYALSQMFVMNGAGTPQGPFGGTPRAIPGLIQAEDFDDGGAEVAYHDNDAPNNGGQYRTGEQVDIEGTTDTGGGYNVGWIGSGEWLEYTVNVNQTGDYAIKMRVASAAGGGSFHISLGATNTTTKSFATTGGWQNWTTIIVPGIFISSGSNQVLRVSVDSSDWNLNYIDFVFGGADVVSVDLAATNIDDGMTSPIGGDGDTVSATIGGHNCRKNMDPNFNDFYFYFTVADIYAFQGNKTVADITFDYYDSGTGSIDLNYDGLTNAYTGGPTVALTNTNTWKTGSFHITDAYFGNRENNGADFRFWRGGAGLTYYIDTVMVFSSVGGPATILNSPFDASAEGWNIVVWRAGPYADGTMAWQSTGGNPNGNMRAAGSGGSNNTDPCTREGGEINKAVSTAGYNSLVQVVYDLRMETNQTGTTCAGSCMSGILEGDCADKLAVYYSTAGTGGPWTLLEQVYATSLAQNTWFTRTINCPAGANNQANFAVRFRWQFNQSSDGGRLDNVKVIATP